MKNETFKNIKEVCEESFECKGDCWVNSAGSFEAWEIIANHCNGKKEIQKLIKKAFYSGIESKEIETLCDNLGITGHDKEFLLKEGLRP